MIQLFLGIIFVMAGLLALAASIFWAWSYDTSLALYDVMISSHKTKLALSGIFSAVSIVTGIACSIRSIVKMNRLYRQKEKGSR